MGGIPEELRTALRCGIVTINYVRNKIMETSMLDVTKKVTTRDGRSVRIICTDKMADFPIVALVQERNTKGDIFEVVMSFKADGRFCWLGQERACDLINVTKKIPYVVIAYQQPPVTIDNHYMAFGRVVVKSGDETYPGLKVGDRWPGNPQMWRVMQVGEIEYQQP